MLPIDRRPLLSAVACFAALEALTCACPPPPPPAPCPCLSAQSLPSSTASAKPGPEQCTETAVHEPKNYELETVDDTAVLRLYADGFVDLPVRERLLAYWLSQAALAGDPITWDQRSRYGLVLKELAEELVLHASALDPVVRPRIELFAKKLWLNKGIYEGWSQRKLVPPFTPAELQSAARAAFKAGAKFKGVASEADLDKHLAALQKILFDPKFEPQGVNKSPPAGKDVITASASTYYEGLTLRDLAGYKETHPLNSRVVKKDKGIEEQVYRVNSPGLYSAELSKVVEALRHALPYASENQRKSLESLIAYFEQGEAEDFRKYSIAWIRDDPAVDAILGFQEQYGDPRGVHGEYEAAVFAVDKARSAVMKKIAAEAPYFEAKMPWLEAYKRTDFKPPVANAVVSLVLAGGTAPVTPVGINLPNDQSLRQTYGSKNFFLSSVDEAASAVQGKSLGQHLMLPSQLPEWQRCASSIHTAAVALHEITGHGSGKVNPALQQDPKALLREYGASLEEARAELVALHASWDPKARELGLLPDEACVQMMAQSYPARFFFRLRMVPGDRIEQDHVRAQSLIVRYALDKGALREQRHNGHVYLDVVDYGVWRKAVAELLAELMRIKAEGDYAKAKELFEKYGARVVPAWRDDIVLRLKAAGVPAHYAFVSPRLKALKDDKGNVVDATIVDSLSLIDTALVDAGKKAMP